MLNAQTVKRQKEEVEELIFNMRDVAISPKYNFEKPTEKINYFGFLLIENLQGVMYSVNKLSVP